MSDNISRSLRIRLRQRARKQTYSVTEWHAARVREMQDRAGVSRNEVVRTAIEFLAVNFDPQMFRRQS